MLAIIIGQSSRGMQSHVRTQLTQQQQQQQLAGQPPLSPAPKHGHTYRTAQTRYHRARRGPQKEGVYCAARAAAALRQIQPHPTSNGAHKGWFIGAARPAAAQTASQGAHHNACISPPPPPKVSGTLLRVLYGGMMTTGTTGGTHLAQAAPPNGTNNEKMGDRLALTVGACTNQRHSAEYQ